eukprot:UN23936
MPVFGLPIEKIKKTKLKEYESPIPNILINLRIRLMKLDGLKEEGIFRKAPMQKECNEISDLVNIGGADTVNNINCSVHVLANLLKIWFREIPERPIFELN